MELISGILNIIMAVVITAMGYRLGKLTYRLRELRVSKMEADLDEYLPIDQYLIQLNRIDTLIKNSEMNIEIKINLRKSLIGEAIDRGASFDQACKVAQKRYEWIIGPFNTKKETK